jgi:hypothetical protein
VLKPTPNQILFSNYMMLYKKLSNSETEFMSVSVGVPVQRKRGRGQRSS